MLVFLTDMLFPPFSGRPRAILSSTIFAAGSDRDEVLERSVPLGLVCRAWAAVGDTAAGMGMRPWVVPVVVLVHDRAVAGVAGSDRGDDGQVGSVWRSAHRTGGGRLWRTSWHVRLRPVPDPLPAVWVPPACTDRLVRGAHRGCRFIQPMDGPAGLDVPLRQRHWVRRQLCGERGGPAAAVGAAVGGGYR